MKPGWWSYVAETAAERELLKYIAFWWPKASPRRNGYQWLVKSIADMQQQVGGNWSDRTIRRSLKALQERGIVIAERHLNPFVNHGGPVLWMRLDRVKIQGVLAERWPNTGRELAETYIQTTDNQIEQVEEFKPGASHPAGQQPGGHDMGKGADLLMRRKSKSIETGLSKFDVKLTSKTVSKPSEAYSVLRDACLAAGLQPPGTLNMKAAGQLKLLLARMEDIGVGEDEAAKWLTDIVTRWSEFAGWCVMTYNLHIAPNPNPAGLLTKVVEIHTFLQSYSSTQVTEKTSAGGSNLDEGL